jgi:ligand-binding SRPBCC domain-containing protein
MKVFQLKKKQKVPISIKEAWEYFSNPRNLIDITPPELQMKTSSEIPDKMYRGEIITYVIKPLLGISMNWVTEITHVIEGEEFIDEQRFGPYKFWHHLHTFKEIKGGVEVGDLFHYGLPFGPFSSIVNAMFIQSQLNTIFSFREKVLEKKFGLPKQ